MVGGLEGEGTDSPKDQKSKHKDKAEHEDHQAFGFHLAFAGRLGRAVLVLWAIFGLFQGHYLSDFYVVLFVNYALLRDEASFSARWFCGSYFSRLKFQFPLLVLRKG